MTGRRGVLVDQGLGRHRSQGASEPDPDLWEPLPLALPLTLLERLPEVFYYLVVGWVSTRGALLLARANWRLQRALYSEVGDEEVRRRPC